MKVFIKSKTCPFICGWKIAEGSVGRTHKIPAYYILLKNGSRSCILKEDAEIVTGILS